MILKESQSTYGKMKRPRVAKIRKPLFPGGSSILLLEPSGKSLVELGNAYAPAFMHAHAHSWLPNIPFVNYCHLISVDGHFAIFVLFLCYYKRVLQSTHPKTEISLPQGSVYFSVHSQKWK